MASITLDQQTLSIAGRRRWLVIAGMDYARTPAPLWEDRLRAAKQAGFNTVLTRVVWTLHEPFPGKFDFTGDLDLAEFIRAVGRAGMLCMLRVGPFVGGGWDAGGLPPWVADGARGRLRNADPAFLEASSRFLSAVMRQVKGLQVAGTGQGGPIVLVQNEHQWHCGKEEVGVAYRGELARYLRENGLVSPTINTNNLFQSLEAEIEAWSGAESVHSTLRQLRAVRPDTPRFALDLSAQTPDAWGRRRQSAASPGELLHRLAQTLAAGAQFHVSPFHGGTTFGFLAGRDPVDAERFYTTSNDRGAPLGETGGRGDRYGVVKRIATFASSFERVFGGLDPQRQPIMLAPEGATKDGVAVAHCEGAQGSIAFLFADPSPKAKRGKATLTLSEGSWLEVDLSGQPAVWCLFNVLLGRTARLDYCSANAFANVEDIFVCYAPAGARVALSIDGAPMEASAPGGKRPLVERHEGVTVVICNEEQIDATYLGAKAVFVGAAGLDADGDPIVHPKHKQCTVIEPGSGQPTFVTLEPAPPAPRAPALKRWRAASLTEYITGESERFATIDGPASLQDLGASHGYGWMRVGLKVPRAKKARLGLFEAADRTHLFLGGQPAGVIGAGPGAERDAASVQLASGEQTLTLLLDNLGRVSGGSNLGERKGLPGHLWETTPLRAGKHTIEQAAPVRPLAFRTPIMGLHADDQTDARRVTWTFTHRKKTPIFVVLEPTDASGVLIVNDEPVEWFDPGTRLSIRLDEDLLRRGKNVVQLAVIGDAEAFAPDLVKGTSLHEGVNCLTEKAEWGFARWETPTEHAFEEVAKSAMGRRRGAPVWWRASFTTHETDAPLLLDASGLSKGQIYVNGWNVGRYFVATGDGKKVGPQQRYYLPEPWLKPGEANELLIFDEHGASPAKCRLVYDPAGPMGLS